MKGRALRRSIEGADALRVNAEVPLITTTTEMITPETAKEMLKRNNCNRPVNWLKVDQYAEQMRSGSWRLHDQGIILDVNGNIQTGQKRLWAIIKSGVNVYMRVSRGNPTDVAHLIDRGVPQSARDLASRRTGRAHSPTEASISRAILMLRGVSRPSVDQIAQVVSEYSAIFVGLLSKTRGAKKTRETLMVMAALVEGRKDAAIGCVADLPVLADKLARELEPRTAAECWGKGAAFSLAMERARRIVAAA